MAWRSDSPLWDAIQQSSYGNSLSVEEVCLCSFRVDFFIFLSILYLVLYKLRAVVLPDSFVSSGTNINCLLPYLLTPLFIYFLRNRSVLFPGLRS